MAKKFYGDGGRLKVVPGGQKDTSDPKISKEKIAELMNSPATVKDVIEISQSVLADTVPKMIRDSIGALTDVVVAQTIHTNALKKSILDHTGMSESEYEEILKSCTEEYNKQRQEAVKSLNK